MANDDVKGLLKQILDFLPTLATKADVEAVRTELKADVEAVRTELKADVGAVRTEMKTGQARLEAGQARLEAGQASLEAGQVRLEAGQANLEAGQARLAWSAPTTSAPSAISKSCGRSSPTTWKVTTPECAKAGERPGYRLPAPSAFHC
jgi:hypothetical protein